MKQSFDQGRKNESNRLGEYANQYYEEYWSVQSMADVEDSDGEYPDDPDKLNAIHLMDYAGVDKILKVKGDKRYKSPKMIFVAQRILPKTQEGNMFSLRMDTGTDVAAEKEKYMNGFRGEGAYPGVYGFGKEADDGESLRYFHLIDMKWLLRYICEGTIDPDFYHRNNDRSKGEFYTIQKLRRKNCILESWGSGWEKPFGDLDKTL